MNFPWRRNELQRVALGALVFTNKEAKRIRANVRKRMQAAKSQTSVLLCSVRPALAARVAWSDGYLWRDSVKRFWT